MEDLEDMEVLVNYYLIKRRDNNNSFFFGQIETPKHRKTRRIEPIDNNIHYLF